MKITIRLFIVTHAVIGISVLFFGCNISPETRYGLEQAAQAMQESSKQMQAQTEANNARSQAMLEANAQRSNEMYKAMIQAPKPQMPVITMAQPYPSHVEKSSALPTQQQLKMPGIFTGHVKEAADGSQWWEYKRADGSTFWSPPGQDTL